VFGRWRLAGVLGMFGVAAASAALPACVNDPDCGVCDPDNLILQSIAGVNYAGKIVKLLGPECEGDSCPGELTEGLYFVEKIKPCIETEDAIKSPRGYDEWCRVSPMIVDQGVQFIFNNLLDPTSVELTRKQPANPQLREVFDWKTQIVHLEGPITRFNGDYRAGAVATAPDLISRATNLACIENLAKTGQAYNHTVLADNPAICDGTYKAEDGKVWPLKTTIERINEDGKSVPATVETYRGETDVRRQAQSCTTPQTGPDTCCDACDYELAINVAKYGVDANGDRVGFSGALTCDAENGDKYKECAAFIPFVDRSQEVRTYVYEWDGKVDEFKLPHYDKLRETHPDRRRQIEEDQGITLEQRTVPCQDDADCTSEENGANLPGMECVGTDGDGRACSNGDDCTNKRCVAEWFVDCVADEDTTGAQGYCVDKRWSGDGTAACFTAEHSYYVCVDPTTCATENDGKSSGRYQGKGSRFGYADADGDGEIKGIEGCRNDDGSVPDDAAAQQCDPLLQSWLTPVPRYDRKDTLPSSTRNCICEDQPAEGCEEFVTSLCREDGDASKPIIKEREGQYALKFVSRNGGVIYDPAIKGVLFLPADLGIQPRSLVENCSAARGGAGGLSIKDGWRANDNGGEKFESFDRAMCSSSTYKVVFNDDSDAEKSPVEYIRDKVGNTLRGKSTYVLKTPDFHVIPGSGFPTDNLRIGACDDFELRFSNKYDMSEVNLKKLQIVEIDDKGNELGRVAGGVDCSTDPEAGIPCLTINVRDQEIGAVRVAIDTQLYGADVLVAGRRYRLKVPGVQLGPKQDVFDIIGGQADASGNANAYRDAFWDACGMPLVTSMPLLDDTGKVVSSGGKRKDPDYFYDFKIDEPKPKEDKEQDDVPFSCDNAPDHFNPGQEDMDNDGYGDIVDLCPSIPVDNNTSDQDKDGIGNACDLCQRQVKNYNENAEDAGAPTYMQVRNIPYQADFDQDGIGDVCDNCIVRANCGDFGPAADGKRPAGIGDATPFDEENVCQVDKDEFPFVGDACIADGAPIQLDGAAAPVGVQDADDFDQDGIINIDDKCPRIRVEPQTCMNEDECPAGSDCTNGVCNHVDSDNDGVGDFCDTCPNETNPSQALEGGMQEDDGDGDFVGVKCETNSACYVRTDPRRVAFYDKSSNGQCCVQLFKESLGIKDPGLVMIDETTAVCTVVDPVVPLTADCPEDQENITCRKLPNSVINTPGVVSLPPGCDSEGAALNLDSPGINGDSDELYKFACLMPQSDQDFDGIGDECDLCPFAFDPDNAFYKDENNKVWSTYGKFCRGNYDPDKGLATCEEAADTDTDTDTGTGTGTGTDTGG
jgi:hypothetical protein